MHHGSYFFNMMRALKISSSLKFLLYIIVSCCLIWYINCLDLFILHNNFCFAFFEGVVPFFHLPPSPLLTVPVLSMLSWSLPFLLGQSLEEERLILAQVSVHGQQALRQKQHGRGAQWRRNCSSPGSRETESCQERSQKEIQPSRSPH